ncbi:MarR family winged helix-turn-helix transcriptional regulator [Jeotgalibacillus sp. R-1-5s-1]|uniref:MarR family winged helix-turn-helix transcriptional regulator n=1 Tax=Jeotgalibacillus sp. R-1-5s-1 TaxID=2555897 RepID=UPI0010698661|nr:MarR family winged helix-turn-helix transcriptional regulator [Jeotgalibacillus sp. R-1-5s-1]TFD94486.1 MarR family transcriptional regulator [Jeotgalibacillus sp. R-1-5s-1]
MKEVKQLNECWTDLYFNLHYHHEEKISHQAVRIMQLLEKSDEIGIKEIAAFLGVSHNTGSEHVKRLIDKKYIEKFRSKHDERRVVLALTESGRSVLHRHTSLDEKKLQMLLESLSDKERESVLNAFALLSEKAKSCF